MTETLKLVLNKFTRIDLRPALLEWGGVGRSEREIDELVGGGSKQDALLRIANEYEQYEQPEDAVEQLAIICMQRYHKRKIWSVHRLKETAASRRKSGNPRAFRKRLEEVLNNYFHADVSLRVKDNAYWIRLEITDAKDKVSIPFVVYYPGSPYLFLTSVRVSLMEYLLQGFLTTLGCREVEEMHLTGKCIASLAQLATHKHFKGSFETFQASQPANDEMVVSRQKKRKASEEDDQSGIILEHREEKHRRLDISDKTFGVKTQPHLEKVTYKLEAPFHVTPLTPGMMNRQAQFHCTVRFEGTSVLEGLRNLAEAGIAELPMRPHLAKLNCMGKNIIVLKAKSGANRSAVSQ